MTIVDAVVVGSGHQGLTTALYLARAGWDVAVFERNSELGGATRSAEITEPGLLHDLYATNLNPFRGSPVFADFGNDLERAGFRTVTSGMPYANVFPDGRSLRVYSEVERTLAMWSEHSERDLAGWTALGELHGEFLQHLMPAYGQPMPSLAAGRTVLGALWRLGVRRVLELGGLLACSSRELGERWFESPEAKTMLACWGMHLDLAPDVSFGAMIPFVQTFSEMATGMSIAEGGAGALPRALGTLVSEAGATVRTGSPVVAVTTDTTGRARRAVIAGTTPTQLFGTLLAGNPAVSVSARRRADRFQYRPGTMMLHLALDGPVPWSGDDDLRDFAYVHIGPYIDDLARAYQQSLAGYLPDRPLLVVGQTSRVDPSRTPDEREILWIQVRSVPSVIKGDSCGAIRETGWNQVKEAMADRVIDNMETYAPGLRSLIRTRTVVSPEDLENENPNLVGGDSIAGSHHVAQNFLFRPWLGGSTYETGVPGLYLVGASTWPGGSTNAISGYLLGQKLLRPSGVCPGFG